MTNKWHYEANAAGLRVFNDRGELVIEQIVMWQPIETAPRDNTAFLAYVGNAMNTMVVISWGPYSQTESGWIGWPFADGEPTHWMPLPPPPEHNPSTARSSEDE